MATVFNQRVKHGRLDLHPGVLYGFEDPDASPYFVAAGWAEETADDPVVLISEGEVEIDPDTTFADGEKRGQKVITSSDEGA